MIRRLIHRVRARYHGHAAAYATVWGFLLILTSITVWVSYYNFGNWNVFVAMLVATIKGALVCLYFMHLKYDNRVNQVVFVSAFFFLGIFVSLTVSDELFRTVERPPVIAGAQEKTGGAEMQKYLVPSEELSTAGAKIYAVQCAVCHGVSGGGDGPGAAALNPKPRDFTSGEWRFGGGVARVFKTITEGSPGTSMASFSNLSVQERFALAHFVRSLGPGPLSEDRPEDLAEFGKDYGPRTTDHGLERPKYKVPVSFAIERLARQKVALADVTEVAQGRAETTLGGKLYQAKCLSCHGLNGKGGIPVKQISVNPPVYLETKALTITQSQAEFVRLVSQGLPGSGKPGIAGFTDAEWGALYQYVQSLRP
ncbi:MAG: c-type cytochrome [Deltaproteobacteria bacterium]|nr:c-type cytochrome [Deltaproteobacteria bacterium]